MEFSHIRGVSVFVLCLCLAACGGGSDSVGDPVAPTGTTGPTFVTWNNSANGTVIKDGNNADFAVDASNGQLLSLASKTRLNGISVDSSAHLIVGGVAIGAVATATSTAGTQIATLTCTDGSPMNIGETSDSWFYTCGNMPGTQSPGTGGGMGGAASGTSYVQWTGNTNGSTVLDKDNGHYAIDTTTHEVVSLATNTKLLGTSMDGATLSVNGSAVASVTLVNGSTGTQVAVFQCANGQILDVTEGTGGWSYSCGASGSGAGAGAGSGGGSSSSSDSVNATQCLSVSRAVNGSLQVFNGCAMNVEMTWCYFSTDEPLYACGPGSPAGGFLAYGRGTWTVRAGAYYPFPGSKNTGSVAYFACAPGPSGLPPSPFLTDITTNPPKGVCK